MKRRAHAAVICGACYLVAAGPMAGVAPAATEMKAKVVQRVDLDRLKHPSSDPAGVTYLPAGGRLLIVDCNIDELPTYNNRNLWEVTRTGSLARTGRTTGYTKEPTGVAFDQKRSRLYVSDDDKRRVLTVRAGKDGQFGTSDDSVSSFSTSSFGSGDPEDVTFDPASGELFIVDGVGKRVYRVSADGRKASSFDVKRYGAGDPEGIVYDPTRKSLFVLDHRSNTIYELDPGGRLKARIDVAGVKGRMLAGLTIAPASKGAGMNFWVVDRGLNNAEKTRPYDGKLFELSVPISLGR